MYLMSTGESGDAASVELNRALEIEPNSLSINVDLCQHLYFLRRYDQAIAQCERALAIDPRSHNAKLYLYDIYNITGSNDAAVEAFFKVEESESVPLGGYETELLRGAYSLGGIKEFWKTRIAIMNNAEPLHYRIARHYALLGNDDQSLQHLEKAYEKRDLEFIMFLSDPVFRQIRNHPRFIKLRTEMRAG
jgi:tetratricopeptide (TPR) repeat protein